MLLIPGTHDEATQREMIRTCGADVVCLDLEDTVVPARKQEARELLSRLFSEDIWGRTARGLRINAVTSPYAADDVTEVVTRSKGMIDVIMMSKADSAGEVRWLDALLTQLCAEQGIERTIKISVGIETARALTDIDEIAAASPRLEALGFAIGDLSTSLGVRVSNFLVDRKTYPGDLFHFVRSRINLAAKAHGLLSLDGPWPIINDHATLAEDAAWGAMLGMDGKLALSIEQVKVIHEAYRPTPAELAYAERMLALMAKAEAAGEGSAVVDGVFLDPVVIGHAKATLARSAAPL
jgi:citrate lyase subunit beta/citryl-CoA lyase